MKSSIAIWLAVFLIVGLLIWDHARHEALRVCVIEEGHSWVGDKCCPTLVGYEVFNAVECPPR